MHLFSRAVNMVGPPGEVMAYASDMRQYVSDKLGQDIGLWSGVFGVPVGSMVYTARVEGTAGAMHMMTTLADDPGYHAKLAEGAAFRGAPAMDSLNGLIHGELGDSPPVGSVAAVTTAQIATGQYAEALPWGVKVAQRIEHVTGAPCMFMRGMFGPFGGVTWIIGYPDAATADAANEAVNGDAEYMQMLGEIGGMFVESSGHQSMVVRVA